VSIVTGSVDTFTALRLIRLTLSPEIPATI
jgi:hypothetical protein